jgi:hypothetical protein
MDTPRLTWWDDDKQEERGMALAERRTNGIGGGERLAEARAGVWGVCNSRHSNRKHPNISIQTSSGHDNPVRLAPCAGMNRVDQST